MAAKKDLTEKLQIRQFKDKSSNFFVDYAHYHLNQNNELEWCAGESDSEDKRVVLMAYIKRNKKTYVPRQITSVIEYFERLDFGIHKGKKTDEVDKKYLSWLIKNFDFAGKEKLKQEIINILK